MPRKTAYRVDGDRVVMITQIARSGKAYYITIPQDLVEQGILRHRDVVEVVIRRWSGGDAEEDS